MGLQNAIPEERRHGRTRRLDAPIPPLSIRRSHVAEAVRCGGCLATRGYAGPRHDRKRASAVRGGHCERPRQSQRTRVWDRWRALCRGSRARRGEHVVRPRPRHRRESLLRANRSDHAHHRTGRPSAGHHRIAVDCSRRRRRRGRIGRYQLRDGPRLGPDWLGRQSRRARAVRSGRDSAWLARARAADGSMGLRRRRLRARGRDQSRRPGDRHQPVWIACPRRSRDRRRRRCECVVPNLVEWRRLDARGVPDPHAAVWRRNSVGSDHRDTGRRRRLLRRRAHGATVPEEARRGCTACHPAVGHP